MWSVLSNSCHASEASSEYSQGLRPVLVILAQYSWANRVYGHWSHNVFLIGTSSSSSKGTGSQRSGLASLEMDPVTKMIVVGSPIRDGDEWGMWKENGHLVRVGRWDYVHAEQAAQLINEIIVKRLEPFCRN